VNEALNNIKFASGSNCRIIENIMSFDSKNQLVGTDWSTLWEEESRRAYFEPLLKSVDNAYAESICFPPKPFVFNAFLTTPLQNVKIVILGQDPYHQKGQAHGLSFSVPATMAAPPSLRNILKELHRDPLVSVPMTNDLTGWAKQGVLLLNTWLTVEAGKPGSHRLLGWEQWTDACIRAISETKNQVIFMLWGAPAQKKQNLIDQSKHVVLTAPHPSPLSAHRGFIGCGHFSQANAILLADGKDPIDWSCSSITHH
jgi:uracil-DNA glycosylase